MLTLTGILNALKLEKHPDKTFIGRIETGFDFLGYHFSRSGLQLAAKTIANAVEKVHRLYEQKATAPERAAALDDYLTRWVRWTTAGLVGLVLQLMLTATDTQAEKPYTQQRKGGGNGHWAGAGTAWPRHQHGVCS